MRLLRMGAASTTRRRASSPALALAWIAAALVLSIGPVRAAEVGFLHMTWKDCWNGAAGVPALTGGCLSNTGEERLYLGFTLAQPVDQVLGTEAVVDLQAEAATLPEWWHLEPADPGLGLPAGCRYGSLNASQDFTGETGCTDPWLNLGSAFIQGYAVGQPHANPAQARITAVTVVPSPTVVSLDGSHKYYAVKLIIDNLKTVDFGSCPGCPTSVCLVVNAIRLKRTLDAPGGDVLLEGVDVPGANWATWQGAGPADCVAVPVRRSTWGQVKSLYR